MCWNVHYSSSHVSIVGYYHVLNWISIALSIVLGLRVASELLSCVSSMQVCISLDYGDVQSLAAFEHGTSMHSGMLCSQAS